MSHDNPLWGSERIRGELLKLGIVVSKRSIRRYRWRKPTPAGSQRWRTFLSNEIKGIWAADLLVVQTATYRTLYVFFFISHQRRELIHFDVTASDESLALTANQQGLEAGVCFDCGKSICQPLYDCPGQGIDRRIVDQQHGDVAMPLQPRQDVHSAAMFAAARNLIMRKG